MRNDHNYQDELFARVDQLLADHAARSIPLPPPAERKRLRESAGLSLEQIANALDGQTDDAADWETGRREPAAECRAAYARLLDGLAALQTPRPEEPSIRDTPSTSATGDTPSPSTRMGEAEQPALFADPEPAAPTPRTPRDLPKVTPAGPLAVIDHCDTLIAHFTNGSELPLEVDDLTGLVQWALNSGLRRERLSPNDRDGDPLLVLTDRASQALGLPASLEDRATLRLADSHPAVTALQQAGLRLTRRGFGPWPRVYRPVTDNKRASVQLAVTAWDALSNGGWNLPPLSPADLARVLGTYTDRVLTPRGSTAVCGEELMTALRPPTRAHRDSPDSSWRSAPNPGALHRPLDPAPPEAPDTHPLAQGRPPEQAMEEEAWDWSREPSDHEQDTFAYVVGLDTNLAFVSAASGLQVGLDAEPRHVRAPAFDKKVPGSWYCDLTHVATDPRLPSPFTSTGQPPTGPAWYATPTLAYAQELGADVRPIEAYLRDDHGGYLTPWYERLRDAYLATMADLGVHQKLPQADYLAAMKKLATADPASLALLAAIKSTGKGGLGKLREGPRTPAAPYTRWSALNKPTWRPDIRAAVVSRARVNQHRKMLKMATQTDRYPVAVFSDCVLYPAHTPTALDVVPPGPDGLGVPGHLRLGVNPGFSKEEGAQTMTWYCQQQSQGLNPGRYIKNSDT